MVFQEFLVGLKSTLANAGFDIAGFVPGLAIALILIIVGIFVGKIVKWLLKVILIRLVHLQRLIGESFLDSLLTLIKWAIYILFINAAIVASKIPFISGYLSEGLAIIPGIIGAVVIIIVGFAVASFLKEGFEKSGKERMKALGEILFIFVLYLSLILALNTAFSSYEDVIGPLILIVTTVFSAAVAGAYLHKKKK